jgi:hypothetical protein
MEGLIAWKQGMEARYGSKVWKQGMEARYALRTIDW